MNGMMQIMMLRSNQIKAEPFSGHHENFPKWELTSRNNTDMAEIAHVLKDYSLEKMPTSEDQELDPVNNSHTSLIKYW